MVIINVSFKVNPFSGALAFVQVKIPASFEAFSTRNREVNR